MRAGPRAQVPTDLPGLDPGWSRVVVAEDAQGRPRSWHVLDNGVEPTAGTLLCVHGNPTWSYLWRGLLAAAPPGWRVVAPDHLGMGYSEQLTGPRSLADRIADLGSLTTALGVGGPVITVGHDWGGIISLGWAVEHRDQLRGLVLTNTAVHQPEGDRGPLPIRLAHVPAIREVSCVRTPIFVAMTSALSRPALPADVRRALAAPYASSERRRSVGDFVADIPFASDHPSRPTVDAVAAGVRTLDVPALLLWGPRDPVFGEKYLADLRERLPQARVHRFEGASHLVTEDAPQYAEAVTRWIGEEVVGRPDAHATAAEVAPDRPAVASLWAALQRRDQDASPAVVEVGGAEVSWAALARRVRDLAAGMAASGIRPGDRIALMVEPSADLTAAVYAAWRAGAVVVVADKGLGLAGLRRALRAAGPDHVIGGAAGLAAARAMGLPGTRIVAGRMGGGVRRVLGVSHGLDDLARRGRDLELPVEPSAEQDCAVVFTSGATGPAKGVAYRHEQVLAQVDLVRATYDLTPEDRLVAAFAPFALLGPALGIGSAVPDIDVTVPGTLTAAALGDAAAAVGATIVFASPAALRNVVATAEATDAAQREALGRVRLLMSAGAPVPLALLDAVGRVLPAASLHTPYGMTEVLPVTDVSADEVRRAGDGDGVCVGRPVAGVEVALDALSPTGTPSAALGDDACVTGEICVRAAHVKDRYDHLWLTERSSRVGPGWHHTGDVGHLDQEGRLWVEGRLVHVITTPGGPVTPVGVEQRVERLSDVRAAAACGVGPPGAQVVVVVVVPATTAGRRRGPRRMRLAEPGLAAAVREVAGTEVAAVLTADRLPLDIRHASKVDRVAVAARAGRLLAGSGAAR